jgi:hypothetical protein
VFGHDLPDELRIHGRVGMSEHVPDIGHIAPGDLRASFSYFPREMAGGF